MTAGDGILKRRPYPRRGGCGQKGKVADANHCVAPQASLVQLGMLFAAWASRQRRIDHRSVMGRFGCSRATAYRWVSAWAEVTAGFVASPAPRTQSPEADSATAFLSVG